MNKNKIILVTLMFFILGCRKEFKENDLFVDKLVYLKKDSTLFTGTLKDGNDASYYYMTFCKGIPCGKWGEREKNEGSFVSKGNYLAVNETLSERTLHMLSNDVVFIDYWQEGGDLLTDPYHFTIYILKNEAFFQENKQQYESYIQELTNNILNDTHNLKYNYLTIAFVNTVHGWSKNYSKEYKVENKKLMGSEYNLYLKE